MQFRRILTIAGAASLAGLTQAFPAAPNANTVATVYTTTPTVTATFSGGNAPTPLPTPTVTVTAAPITVTEAGRPPPAQTVMEPATITTMWRTTIRGPDHSWPPVLGPRNEQQQQPGTVTVTQTQTETKTVTGTNTDTTTTASDVPPPTLSPIPLQFPGLSYEPQLDDQHVCGAWIANQGLAGQQSVYWIIQVPPEWVPKAQRALSDRELCVTLGTVVSGLNPNNIHCRRLEAGDPSGGPGWVQARFTSIEMDWGQTLVYYSLQDWRDKEGAKTHQLSRYCERHSV